MTNAVAARPGLAPVIKRFPQHGLAIREAFLEDESFRSVCEDYALACETLARFEARPDADRRPEIPDFQAVIAELEGEITRLLSRSPQ